MRIFHRRSWMTMTMRCDIEKVDQANWYSVHRLYWVAGNVIWDSSSIDFHHLHYFHLLSSSSSHRGALVPFRRSDHLLPRHHCCAEIPFAVGASLTASSLWMNTYDRSQCKCCRKSFLINREKRERRKLRWWRKKIKVSFILHGM